MWEVDPLICSHCGAEMKLIALSLPSWHALASITPSRPNPPAPLAYSRGAGRFLNLGPGSAYGSARNRALCVACPPGRGSKAASPAGGQAGVAALVSGGIGKANSYWHL